MIRKHELKTDPECFGASYHGLKPFEIRFNDREYQISDQLILRETEFTGAEMAAGKPLTYTGRRLIVRVTYILRGPIFGLADGWVIMGVK